MRGRRLNTRDVVIDIKEHSDEMDCSPSHGLDVMTDLMMG